MSNVFLVGIFASLICFLVGLAWFLINLFQKKNKKTSIMIVIISVIIFVLSVIGFEKTYNTGTDDSESSYKSTYDSTNKNYSEDTSLEASSTENSENPGTSDFEAFINSKPDFSAFTDKYYTYEAEGKASEVRDSLTDAQVTWTGTVIEPMSTRIAIIADDKYNQTTWSNLSDDLRPYVFFAKNIDKKQTSLFEMGDRVTVSGKIISGGSKLANAQWDIDTESISK
ncbi:MULTISPECIES: hypothetical protein [unclassified Enterococcus]|jgi:hypothetical protein|uniref:hypothetical protein n=1 Tax=unclassified Enterococcus TaxID=2608891 RepID=UPI003D26EDD6